MITILVDHNIEGYAVTLWGVGISGVEGAWACLPPLLYFCLDFRQNLVKVFLAQLHLGKI